MNPRMVERLVVDVRDLGQQLAALHQRVADGQAGAIARYAEAVHHLDALAARTEAQLAALGELVAQVQERVAQQQAETGRGVDRATARLAALSPVEERNGTAPRRLPEAWQRIRAYLAAEGPKRPAEVAEALDLPTARDHLRRMTAHGLLTKLALGVYDVGSNGPAAQQ
jgi:hypothetical protein